MDNSILDQKMEQRYCAFLDILGFKNMLSNLEGKPSQDALRIIVSALNFMNEEAEDSNYSSDLPVYTETELGLLESELGNPRLTYISDCIIISTDRTEEGFLALCRKLTKVWIDLAWDGIFCRGAIVEGELFHQGGVVFGQAYLNAVELEKMAVDPGVIIDESIVKGLGSFPSKFPLCPPTANETQDGAAYLRYFPLNFYPPYAYDWSNYLLRVRPHIAKGLESKTCAVQQKFEFLKKEFNFCVKTYAKLLEDCVTQIPE